MSKVSIIGAGNVGATCANIIAFNKISDTVVMLDIKPGIAEGKAIDMLQTAKILGFESNIIGVSNDYTETAQSDVIVITSGVPRKPGMTRESLIDTNAGIVKNAISRCSIHSPNAIFVIITNPVDTMTYLALKSSGLPKNKIIGMGGALDSARFKYYLSQALYVNVSQVEGMVVGGHGDSTMIPLRYLATYNGIPITKLLSTEIFDKIITDTMNGGASITNSLGTSAWYAPGAAGAYVVESIMKNCKRLIPSCIFLEGEYEQKDICIGVPAIIGRDGFESIIDVKLNTEERKLFKISAETIRKTNQVLKNINAL